VTGSAQSQAAMRTSTAPGAIASRLVGVWRLVSYTDEQQGREDSFPFGPEPVGFLIYTPDGFVSAEHQQAGSGYIAYCGAYQVDEEKETVTHTPPLRCCQI
jgi:hypothetical protein